MNTNLLDLNNDVLNIIDYVKKDNNERIQDYDFLYYVITELLHKLKFNKLSKHKMGQIIYSELVDYYHYSDEFITEYILTNKLTEYFKRSKLTKYFKNNQSQIILYSIRL
jgi:hypothetical protein